MERTGKGFREMEKTKLLKTNEAARYLGVSRSSLTNWIRQGKLKGGATPGGHYRFTVRELDEFAAERGLTTFPENFSGAARILIVDDDEAFREFVTDALGVFRGYEIKEASDGMKGAMLVGSWKPDLIVLDIRMPNMDGCELLSLIRENPETAEAGVIVASAHLSGELTESLKKWKPDAVLEKPLHLAKLIASVQKLLDLTLA